MIRASFKIGDEAAGFAQKLAVGYLIHRGN